MTYTVVMPDLEYDVFKSIRRAIHNGNPEALTYESYDGEIKRGIFTFQERRVIPEELLPFVMPMSIPQRYDLSGIELPKPIDWRKREEELLNEYGQ